MYFQGQNLQVPIELFLCSQGLDVRSGLVPCPQLSLKKLNKQFRAASAQHIARKGSRHLAKKTVGQHNEARLREACPYSERLPGEDEA